MRFGWLRLPPAVQLARVQARDGLGTEEARRRIGAQLPLRTKIAPADVVIYNDGTETALKEEVKQILAARKGGAYFPVWRIGWT